MTELEQLREQVRTQEMSNLRKDVIIARLEKQVADLTRMHHANQRHIGRLQAQIKRTPKDAAEAVFRGQNDGQA